MSPGARKFRPGAEGPRRGAPALVPTLGLTSATLLLIGSVIGTGIFLVPALVAREVATPGLVLAAWVLGSVFALAGALTLAELGSMFPRAGGQYVFLREAFGAGPAFTFGWMALTVNYSGAIAALVSAAALFLGVLVPMSALTTKLVAVGILWATTLANLAGVRHGSIVQNVATAGKLAALGAIIVVGLALGTRGAAFDAPLLPPDEPATSVLAGLGLALVPILFAFDGFASVTMVGSEVVHPTRNIPRATVLGVAVIALIYLAANLAFLRLLPFSEFAGSERLAFDAVEEAMGSAGSKLVAAGVMLSALGAGNGYAMQAPRIYYAMARDKLLYPGFASVHARFRTPDFGLILQAEWASILVLTGSIDQLITYVAITSGLFFGLTGLAVFRLRRTRPDAPRPYRAWGYPVVPALFVAAAFAIVVNALVNDTKEALVGLAFVASGVPVYLILRIIGGRRKR